MIRRRLLLLAAPLCVVVVAASVAFASTPDTEHSSEANADPPHVERPIAASDQTLGGLSSVMQPSSLRAILQYRADLERFLNQVAFDQWWAGVIAEEVAAAEAAAAAAVPVSRPSSGGGGGGGGDAGGALACIRARESDSAGGYQAVSSGGTYRGAYQFLQSTWDSTASAAGRGDLVGVDPSTASPADQDAMASHLYSQAGSQPWGGTC